MKFKISYSKIGKGLVRVRGRSDDGQVNVKSQSELDIGGRETCHSYILHHYQNANIED